MKIFNYRIGEEVEMAWGNDNHGLIDGGVDNSRDLGKVVGRRIAIWTDGYGFFKSFYRVRMNGTDHELSPISLRKRASHK